jgi:hypothetical protein
MRCVRPNRGVAAEELVELTPEPAGATVRLAARFYAEHAAAAFTNGWLMGRTERNDKDTNHGERILGPS